MIYSMRVQRVVDIASEHISIRELADMLGERYTYVRDVCDRCQLPYRRVKDAIKLADEYAALVEMDTKDLTVIEISEKLGVMPNTTRRWLKLLGKSWKQSPKFNSQELKDRIFNDNRSPVIAAPDYDMSPMRFSRIRASEYKKRITQRRKEIDAAKKQA